VAHRLLEKVYHTSSDIDDFNSLVMHHSVGASMELRISTILRDRRITENSRLRYGIPIESHDLFLSHSMHCSGIHENQISSSSFQLPNSFTELREILV